MPRGPEGPGRRLTAGQGIGADPPVKNFNVSAINSKVPFRFLDKRVFPCLTSHPWCIRLSDFKCGIWLQRRATSHMAFRIAVQLVAVCRLERQLVCRGRCSEEVAATVRGMASREEFDPVRRSLKVDNVKGYFAT